MTSIKHEWYQTDSTVSIEILAKGINVEALQVKFYTDQVEVKLETASGASFERKFDLVDSIDVPKCTYSVSAYKLELSLKKATTGKWKALECGESEAVDQTTVPKYPSSSRLKHNWEDFDKSISKADAGGEPETPDDFFRKLYAGAGDDTRRAMMKSFIESGGTVLSTNWDEVGSKKVEPAPPEGVKYEKK